MLGLFKPSDTCADAYAALAQSSILWIGIFAIAGAVRYTFTVHGLGWVSLLYDVTALLLGAQTPVVIYRVMVVREQCS